MNSSCIWHTTTRKYGAQLQIIPTGVRSGGKMTSIWFEVQNFVNSCRIRGSFQSRGRIWRERRLSKSKGSHGDEFSDPQPGASGGESLTTQKYVPTSSS